MAALRDLLAKYPLNNDEQWGHSYARGSDHWYTWLRWVNEGKKRCSVCKLRGICGEGQEWNSAVSNGSWEEHIFVVIQKVRMVLQLYLSLECVEFSDYIVNCLLPTEALATAIPLNHTCSIRLSNPWKHGQSCGHHGSLTAGTDPCNKIQFFFCVRV